MIVIVFLAALLLLYVLWGLTVKYGLKSLSCTRAFSRPAVFEGEEAELVEVVRNDRSIVIPWLLVESRISPYIRLGKQENLFVSGEMHYCSQFTLLPYQQIRRRHRVRFLHRGSYNLGNASLTAGDIMGFFQFQRTQELNVPVLVYPHLLELDELPIPMSRMLGELTRRQQLLQDPFLVRGIRPYQPGDPVRDIHWPATARTGDVHVRIHDYSARTKLLVVLNGQRSERQWHAHLSDQDAEVIEHGVTLAATVCIRALRDGLASGFAANLPMDGEPDNKPTLYLPEDGEAREEKLLAAFARLKILRAQDFVAMLRDLKAYSGLDLLVLSCYDSEGIQNAIGELRRSGNQVTFQLFDGGGL